MADRITPEARVRGVLEVCYADPSRITAERMSEALADAALHAQDDWAEQAFISSARGLIGAYLLPGKRSLWYAARTVAAPVTLIWGRQDQLVPAVLAPRVRQAFVHAEGGASLTIFEDAGHVAQMELPERTADVVRNALPRVFA